MKLHLNVTLRQLVHPQEILAMMAHEFEHQLVLLYPEDEETEASELTLPPPANSPAPTSPAARDAAKYEH